MNPTVDPNIAHLLPKFPYTYPRTRYTQWTELEPVEKSAAKSLGYVRSTWDNLQVSELEAFRFADLTWQERQHVESLGIDANMWDCFLNHYDGYYWEELPTKVASNYKILGYDQSSWDEGAYTPESENKYWDDLSSAEQKAAYHLCFFQNSWDWISLVAWFSD